MVSSDQNWYTVIDLKDTFFCIPLAKECQSYFAFEWEDPADGSKCQLVWICLPQGYCNNPTAFAAALAQDLKDFDTQQTSLLQYVDDLLIAGKDRKMLRILQSPSSITWLKRATRYLGRKSNGPLRKYSTWVLFYAKAVGSCMKAAYRPFQPYLHPLTLNNCSPF